LYSKTIEERFPKLKFIIFLQILNRNILKGFSKIMVEKLSVTAWPLTSCNSARNKTWSQIWKIKNQWKKKKNVIYLLQMVI